MWKMLPPRTKRKKGKLIMKPISLKIRALNLKKLRREAYFLKNKLALFASSTFSCSFSRVFQPYEHFTVTRERTARQVLDGPSPGFSTKEQKEGGKAGKSREQKERKDRTKGKKEKSRSAEQK